MGTAQTAGTKTSTLSRSEAESQKMETCQGCELRPSVDQCVVKVSSKL